MGVISTISFSEFPKQGMCKGKRVTVCFNYDTRNLIGGICVRDDAEEPYRTIFQLDDGRFVLATECQFTTV